MRVRFAPSPTGALHIGSARTALYNWLLARGHGADFVLRIEDTDRERSTPENVELIFEAMRWLGLDWDGDPVFQSERRDRHAEVVEQLIAGGHAYRSTAGSEQVKAYKEAHGNAGYRGEDEGEGAVRLRMPDEGATVVRDVIRGESAFENRLMDDLVIARADGTPVYHLAVVVDDLDAGITHVVRGADHYSNTPKQMRILEAMGAEVPLYAHVPLLHGPDGKKLSKRHGAASVQELRDAGYLREAVLNYLALLGWGFDDETTYMTVEELQQRFSLERVSKSPAVFDEKKLRHMNGTYIRELRGRGAHPPPGDLHGPLRAGGGGGDLAREVPDDVGVLAAGRVLLRRSGRRPEAAREVARPRGDSGPAGAGAGGPGGDQGAVDGGGRRGRTERGRRAGRRQARQALPAPAGRTGGHDRVARYLRNRSGARAGRDPRASERWDVRAQPSVHGCR